MSAGKRNTLPQEGTGQAGESLLTSPDVSCPSYSGGDKPAPHEERGRPNNKTPSATSGSRVAPRRTVSETLGDDLVQLSIEGGSCKKTGEWTTVKYRRKRSRRRKTAAEPSGQIQLSVPTSSGAQKESTGTRAPKLKRQGTDPEERTQQRPNKRPRNQGSHTDSIKKPTAGQGELSVIIERGDGAVMDEQTAAEIRIRLVDLIEIAALNGVNGRSLQFVASGLVAEGYFLVSPKTEEAMGWLLKCDFGMYQGVPLRPRKLDLYRVSIWLPGNSGGVRIDPLTLIKVQNCDREEDLSISEWNLIRKEVLPLGVRLVVGVPKSAAKDSWLNYQATVVFARALNKPEMQTPKTEQSEPPRCTCPVHAQNTTPGVEASGSSDRPVAPQVGPAEPGTPLHERPPPISTQQAHTHGEPSGSAVAGPAPRPSKEGRSGTMAPNQRSLPNIMDHPAPAERSDRAPSTSVAVLLPPWMESGPPA